ncbi:TPA: hypothetical protein ACP1MF_001846 [Streptococcus pyogenes]
MTQRSLRIYSIAAQTLDVTYITFLLCVHKRIIAINPTDLARIERAIALNK